MPLIRVLVIAPAKYGRALEKIRCAHLPDYCEKEFVFTHRYDEEALAVDLAEFRPHAILTLPDTFAYPRMMAQPISIRSKWLTSLDQEPDKIALDIMAAFMDAVTGNRFPHEPLISVFTPTYNTKKAVIERAYASLRNQAYNNWEWVLYDDSENTDTIALLSEIAHRDYRVRAYRGASHSGSIGETKRNCAGLCRGKILVELDHDDELTRWCLHYLLKAFQAFPDSGFAYTHCAEVNQHGPQPEYCQGFAYGYGSYRDESFDGQSGHVMVQPQINAKTIRYITACPNHVRAWKTSAYWTAGGHNPAVDIGDDYELIVRTFLTTKMVRVNLFGYIQHYHSSNSQDARRPEIQRIVTSVSVGYEQRIHTRLLELDVPDFIRLANGQNDYAKTCAQPHHCNYEYNPFGETVISKPVKVAPIAVITACTRPENIEKIHASIGEIPVHWIIVEDVEALKGRRVTVPRSIHRITVLCHSDKADHAGGQCVKNRGLEFVLNTSKEKWVYFLDDDNLMHPGLVPALCEAEAPIVVFPQLLDNGDVRDVDIRVGSIDQAQYALRATIIGSERIPLNYKGDGEFIVNLSSKNTVLKMDKPLCYYNRLLWAEDQGVIHA